MSPSAFEKTYEKYCMDLYQKQMEIYTMKQELTILQSEIEDENCELLAILDLQCKFKVIREKLEEISKQIKVIENSIQMLETRFFISNNFY